MLEGSVVEEPTVVYVPRNTHYTKGFQVWSTSTSGDSLQWDGDLQLLYWHPSKQLTSNTIFISEKEDVQLSKLPKEISTVFEGLTSLGRFE